MKVKELKQILKDYDDNTDIIIGGIVNMGYQERELDLQDIADSNLDGKKRLVIAMHETEVYF